MKFTGERAIMDAKGESPEQSANIERINKDHLYRYNLASKSVSGKVLDASCGSGYGTEILGADGVDVSEEAIEYAKSKYKAKFSVVDLNKDFPDGKFDWVVSFETIEHLENPEFFLENIRKNAKKVFLSIPLNSPSEFHYHVYTREQAEELINTYFVIDKWELQNGRYLIAKGRTK